MSEVKIPKKIQQNFKVVCEGRTKFFESMDAVLEWVFSEECPNSDNFRFTKVSLDKWYLKCHTLECSNTQGEVMGKHAVSAAGVKNKSAVKVLAHYVGAKSTTIKMSTAAGLDLASNLLSVLRHTDKNLKPIIKLAIRRGRLDLSVIRDKETGKKKLS